MDLVEKNDWITFDLGAKKVQTIEWSQNLSSKKAAYIAVPYLAKDKQTGGAFFIQSNFLDQLIKMSQVVKGDKYQVRITEDFQYGQDKDKTVRFLVYHNKCNKPYQHRFTSTSIFKDMAEKLHELGGHIPDIGNIIGKMVGVGEAFIGDHLKNFNPEK